MSDNGSKIPPPEIEIAPDVALFIESLLPVQRTFFIRAIAPSQFNLTLLWNEMGRWWNGLEGRERMALVTESFNLFYQGREKGDDDSIQD
jgi:hypothetical protein